MTLDVTIGGYDKTNPSLQSIDFQYRYYGLTGWGAWVTKMNFQKAELGEFYTDSTWNMQYNPDGEYEVRTVANCTNGQQTMSLSRAGFLDKSDPVLIASVPANNILKPGNEIYFKYSEPLNPITVNLTHCTLHNIDDLQTDLPLSILLVENGTKIKFTLPPSLKYFAENHTLVAKVSGIEDIHGNPLAVPDSIIFYVDLGPLHWSSPTNITLYDEDGMDIAFSKMLENSFATSVYYQIWHADWLTPDPQQGEIDPQESWQIDFTANDLETGSIYYDTIMATTLGYADEIIRLKIIVGNVSPVFEQQPVSQTAAPGETVVFEAWADGFPNPNYYWKKNSEVIPDAIDSLLILENISAADTGSYQCIAWNNYGEAVSEIATLSLHGPLTQSINIPGGWSGLSSYLMPDDADLVSLFGPILDELVIAATETGIFYPAENINTIGNWEPHSAYKINTNSGVSLNLTGTMEENKTLQLDAGWNLIPVVSSCPANVEALFAAIVADLVIVKEVAGFGVYWPEMGINNLGTINPGKAYYVKMAIMDSVVFDECDKSSTAAPTFVFPYNPSWNTVEKTAANHVIGILANALHDFEPGDYIGVFTPEGICAGQMVVDAKRQVSALMAFGRDEYASQSRGFHAGEMFRFRLYRTATGEEYELIPAWDLSQSGTAGMFSENGISIITGFKISNTGVNSGEMESHIYIFPNPTKGKFIIRGLKYNAQIEIFDMHGQVIRCEVSNTGWGSELSLAGKEPGIYIVRIQHGDGQVYRKLILE